MIEGRASFRESDTPATATDGVADLRVLVVDDDQDIRQLVASVLAMSGARTTCAGSCAEALAIFARERPDVVVADIGLPDEDGYALIRRIRALAPADGGRVPAVALTGRLEASHRAVSSGYHIALTKPVGPEEILATVAELGRRAVDRSSAVAPSFSKL